MRRGSWIPIAVYAACLLAACGSGGGGSGGNTPNPSSLNHAAYIAPYYQYGAGSMSNVTISGAPDDVDWYRWAMLDDGTQRLYFFKAGSSTTLYQFGYHPAADMFEFGYAGNTTHEVTGAPVDADPASFAMLHDGTFHRLYMRSISDPTRIHQYRYNSASNNFEYGFGSTIPVIDVTGAPADVDWDRWAMLHDGTRYRHHAFRQGSNTVFYQFAYNPAASDYQYGFESLTPLTVRDMPADSYTGNFSMLHDGTNYHFYFLAP